VRLGPRGTADAACLRAHVTRAQRRSVCTARGASVAARPSGLTRAHTSRATGQAWHGHSASRGEPRRGTSSPGEERACVEQPGGGSHPWTWRSAQWSPRAASQCSGDPTKIRVRATPSCTVIQVRATSPCSGNPT